MTEFSHGPRTRKNYQRGLYPSPGPSLISALYAEVSLAKEHLLLLLLLLSLLLLLLLFIIIIIIIIFSQLNN